MRSKLKDPGLRRESCVWCVTALYRPAVSGTCPDRCGANGPLRKSERIGSTANPPSPALYAARDQKLIGMLTEGRGGRQGSVATGFLTKNRQNDCQNISFWGHVRSSKWLGRRFCRNRYFFIIKLLNKFSRNLRSKSARSTLTSPGPIRVKSVNFLNC